MPVNEEARKTVQKVFEAMHARADGEAAMRQLFADDAVVVEPFSGHPRTHRGKADIMAWFLEAVAEMPPDMTLRLDRLDMDGDRVRAEWTCTASVFPTPMRGYDLYKIVKGKIEHAEFIVTEMPPMGQ